MLFETILNHRYPLKGFVYGNCKIVANSSSGLDEIHVAVAARKNSKPRYIHWKRQALGTPPAINAMGTMGETKFRKEHIQTPPRRFFAAPGNLGCVTGSVDLARQRRFRAWELGFELAGCRVHLFSKAAVRRCVAD